MAERMKVHRKTRFLYDDGGVQIGEEEEVYEPVEQVAAPEFAGITETASLPHGQVPAWPEGERSIFKVYEKVAVWLRRPQGASAL
jgi:hypothetical protein